MMRTTRRGVMAGGFAGALAVPTLAGLASWRGQHGLDAGQGSVLLFDPTLGAGRRFADAGRAAGATVLALDGDPVRTTQGLLGKAPALLAGIGRHADALLVEEVALEAGYTSIALLHGIGVRCTASSCRPGWQPVARMAQSAGPHWPEALATFAVRPDGAQDRPRGVPAPQVPRRPARSGEHAFGWLLVRRG